MNQQEMVDAIALGAGINKTEALRALKAITAGLTLAMQNGDRVIIQDFGTFDTRTTKQRNGTNPRTSQPIIIPAETYPTFNAAAALDAALN